MNWETPTRLTLGYMIGFFNSPSPWATTIHLPGFDHTTGCEVYSFSFFHFLAHSCILQALLYLSGDDLTLNKSNDSYHNTHFSHIMTHFMALMVGKTSSRRPITSGRRCSNRWTASRTNTSTSEAANSLVSPRKSINYTHTNNEPWGRKIDNSFLTQFPKIAALSNVYDRKKLCTV